MKSKVIASFSVFLIFLFTASALADVLHIWTCELNAGKSYTDAMDASSAWLKAAKHVEDGEDFQDFLDFPVAANVEGGSLNFVLAVVDAKTWGRMFDNAIPDSAIAEANSTWSEVAACSGSSIWNSVEIE